MCLSRSSCRHASSSLTAASATAGRGCEGVADVPQQQELLPRLLPSHGYACCCGGSGGEGVRGWRMFFVRPPNAHAAFAPPPPSPAAAPATSAARVTEEGEGGGCEGGGCVSQQPSLHLFFLPPLLLLLHCEAEIYAGAMAAQELRWLTYLLADLGEPPRSPPVLYVDNKAMLALCREHRLEHRTKHIALRYFLARELQQRGQLRLAYVASEANTADIFTKALPPGDHQHFYTMLGFPTCAAGRDRGGGVAAAAAAEAHPPPPHTLSPPSPSRGGRGGRGAGAELRVRLLGVLGLGVLSLGGAETGGAEPGGVEPGGAEPGGAEPEGVEPGGAASEGAESGGAEPQGAALSGGSAGASPRLSPQQLREWFVWRARLQSGATGAGGAGVAAGAGITGGTAATSPGGAHTRGTGAAGTGGVGGAGSGDPTESRAAGAGGSGAGGAGAGGAGVGGTGARGAGVGGTGTGGAGAGGARAVDPGGAMRPRPYLVPLLQQPRCPSPCTAPVATAASATSTAPAATATMASPTVLTFDAEGRAVKFDVWVDDMQLFLQCDSMDGVSLFDHTSGVSTAPAATADCTVCSQWTTRDVVARLAVRSHPPPAERAHFVADLVSHLRTSDARYRAALPTEDHFLSLCPTELTVDLLEERLAAAEKSSRPPVSGADLQWVDQFASGDQRVTQCTCSRTGRHLATFTRRPGSSLYTLTTAPPPVSASGQVAASSQVFAAASRSSPASAPCSCRPLTHETLLWHHRLGHPSLPPLRGMASRNLRAAPHSSFPSTEAPLQTLHMDVWGPARVRGQGHERYFLLVVDDYSRYTSVFLLHSKGDITEGIRQTFTLPASPQQNGIAERRIGMVMDVARTSMIYAPALHFLWPFADQYAAHQINLQPRVSLPETTPTLRWIGKVGNASAFRVCGSRAFLRDTSADKLSSRAVPCVFLGFPPDTPGWQFYHPTSRCVLSFQDVTFDESVSYVRLFPYRAASLPPPATLPSTKYSSDLAEPVKVAVDLGAARGAEPAGAGTGGAEHGDAEPGDAKPERVEPGGADSGSAASWGAEPMCVESGGSLGVPLWREPLSPQRLRIHTGGTGAAGTGALGVATGAGGAAGAGAAGGAAGAGAAGGASGAGAAGATRGATGAGAGGGGTGAVSAVSKGAARPRPYYFPLLQQVLGLPPSPGPTPPLLSPLLVQSQLSLQPSSPLPGPSPYSGPTRGLTERREPESRPVSPVSRPASPVRTARAGCVFRPRPPPVPGTHSMALLPSTAPQCVPLPSPPASSFPYGPDPKSDSFRATSPTVTRFLATAVTDPLFESSTASALVAELVDFAAAYRLDYATSLVAECASASVCPPSVEGECALGMDVLEERQEEFECFAAAVPHLMSMLLAPERDPDAPDIPTPRSYAEALLGP
ncbi:unnamed protein product [Closterium sp. NIES-54]